VAAELSASNHELTVVLMTGYSAVELEDEGRHIRNLRILPKPFGADHVLNVIREMAADQRS
jgi:FixJ family two-component response regulator